jgi:hypothetical protein
MTPETLEAWGWRLPLLFGLVVGLAALLLRRQLIEAEPVHVAGRAPIIETCARMGGS